MMDAAVMSEEGMSFDDFQVRSCPQQALPALVACTTDRYALQIMSTALRQVRGTAWKTPIKGGTE